MTRLFNSLTTVLGFFVFFLFCTSCVSNDLQTRLLKSSGTLKIDDVQGTDEQLKILIRNKNDYQWSADDPNARAEMANKLFAERCHEYKIISETVTETGNYAQGRTALMWTYIANCKKKQLKD